MGSLKAMRIPIFTYIYHFDIEPSLFMYLTRDTDLDTMMETKSRMTEL